VRPYAVDMHVPRVLPLVTAIALLALPACGGNGEDAGKDIYTRDAVASCLQRAGATKLRKSEAGDFPGKIAQEGAIEGSVGNSNFALVFEPDVDTARSSETLYAGAQGGSWQKGVLLDFLLKRSQNAVLVYERLPTDKAAKTVEGCLGGDPKIDADVAEQFGR
jgi:hypothetical protein